MRPAEENSEEILIERLKNQEERALEELVEIYEPEVFRVVRQLSKCLLPEEDVQEIANDTFYQLWRHAANLDIRKGSLGAYLVKRISYGKGNGAMKKRITDFMDDLPAEEVENLMNRTAGKKRRRPSFGTFKIAVAAACIAALGGGVAYAYTHPGFLQEYLGIGEDDRASLMIMEEEQSAENDDYRLTIEEIAGDDLVQMVLVGLEPKNGESRAYLNERRINRPVITVDGKEPEIYSVDRMDEAMSEEDLETGKEYYLFTLEECRGAGAVYFGEGLKTVDVAYDTGWLEEHKAGVVSLDFSLENVMSESLVLEPGELADGITYDRIVIGHFSVSGTGSRTSAVRLENVMPVPTITAVYKDGSEGVLQPGNMSGDPQAHTAASGGTITSMEPEGDGIGFQSVLTSYVDIGEIKEIRINEDAYAVGK